MTTNNAPYASASASASGVGFSGLLTILFVALKLTHVINWSWVWVASPLWISFLLYLAFAILFGLVAVTFVLIKHFVLEPRRKRRYQEAIAKNRARRQAMNVRNNNYPYGKS